MPGNAGAKRAARQTPYEWFNRMANKTKIALAADDRSKSQQVYDFLRRRIRALEIPAGAALSKEDIALACGVSRAPVNEAIARLASEGLVDVFPQNGSFVSPIRMQDIRESMFLRMALEVEAVKYLTHKGDKAVIGRLDENIRAQALALQAEKVNLAAFDDLDEALHAEIMRATGHPRAMHLLETARVILDRPRFLTLPVDHRPEDTYVEHSRIVEAIKTGEPEFAGSAMKAHLNKVARAMEEKMGQIETQEAAPS
jgi:DNA-binding GntR family transcriptional regulator